jgi:hypothetical protein
MVDCARWAGGGRLPALSGAYAILWSRALQNQEKRFAVDDPIPHCAHKCRVTGPAAVACFGIRA